MDEEVNNGGSTDGQTLDFIRSMVAEDLASGKHGGRVATRFPPEPNGYLHIGHAKAICLSFGIADEVPGGTCNLRFDDTNPTKENVEFVESIQRDIQWLGFQWDALHHASDYFQKLFDYAVHLIEDGKAYVCSLDEEEIRAYRGTVLEAGRNSPYRDRSVAENLDLFERMRAGEFEDGTHVLRAKIDMASPNMKMRDPLLYRIRHAHHYRTGDTWSLYPLYDFTHGLSDSFERITHSLCTLEFENNRELYDWILDQARVPFDPQPRQTEFARLSLNYTILSKRKLLQLVQGGHVSGWDDPRMPTLSGYRRRGYTPESIRDFCGRIGVAKANSTVDVAFLEHSLRDDLNQKVPRVLGVLRPLKVVIENYPDGQEEELEAPYYPRDVPKDGSRMLPFSREIFIEREDFQEDPPKTFFRLAPGREVRLRYAYLIRCERAIKNELGEVVELRCTYDPETRGGTAPDGRKVRGTLHWVSAGHALSAKVCLYERLFSVENPGGGEVDFIEHLNPDSLEIIENARLEPSLENAEPGSRFQFERQGYFYLEPDSASNGERVFNRIVTLKDAWARRSAQRVAEASALRPRHESGKKPTAEKGKARAGKTAPSKRVPRPKKERSQELEERQQRYIQDLGVLPGEAEALTSDEGLADFFEEAIHEHGNASTVAKWVVNDLLRELKEKELSDLPFSGKDVGELVSLIEGGQISGRLGKDVFEKMLLGQGAPKAIVEREGLLQIDRPEELEPVVVEILQEHAEKVQAYRDGKQALFGFFVGQVMKATSGKANPQVANELLRLHLDPS
ncbi:MAG: glutamine--tRNA ligase/YqeY domain fusion protein [Deltaproteobacteria bacterium]|nr:glutamine--tRNA ligase/YqeY domain fusion protein [Deltaproteobacteria bacterium]